eukprot:Opistho-2@16450
MHSNSKSTEHLGLAETAVGGAEIPPGQFVLMADAGSAKFKEGEYYYSLFGCLKECAITCCTCTAYPWMVAKAAGDLNEGGLDWCLFCVAFIFPGVSGLFLRDRTKKAFNLQESEFATFCKACCCTCCATVQDIRELKARGKYDPIWGKMGSNGVPEKTKYSTNICGCCGDPTTCLLTWCCGPIIMGKAAGDVDKTGYDCLLCCCSIVNFWMGSLALREKVKNKYKISEPFVKTLCCTLCFPLCAVTQDVREVKIQGDYSAGLVIDPSATAKKYAAGAGVTFQ